MRSSWWDGDFAVAQPWGCTDYTAEPAVPTSVCASGHIHRGIDLMVPLGTAISAPIDGIRLEAIENDPNGFGPHYPIVRMPDGRQVLFGHTQRVIGGPRMLAKGEVFAYSGNEGLSTGPHVHTQANASPGDFENTVDPVPYLYLLPETPGVPQEDDELDLFL